MPPPLYATTGERPISVSTMHIAAWSLERMLLWSFSVSLMSKRQRQFLSGQPPPADIVLLIRQTRYTYDLFFFLNADERRQRIHTFKNRGHNLDTLLFILKT